VRVPVEGTEVGLYTTLARPGLPLGSATRSAAARKRKAGKLAPLKAGARPGADGDSDGADESTGESAGDDAPANTESGAAPASSGDE